MIIFGSRGITYSAGKGDFDCPTCQGSAPYKHKRVRRFFTLYFIPLIPLDKLGEYVECGSCGGTYEPAVLDHDFRAEAAAFDAEVQKVLRRVMVALMLADGVEDAQEVATIRRVYGEFSGSQLSEEDVRREVAAARTDGRSVIDYLTAIAGALNDQGKELVMQAALNVAAADGNVGAEEEQLIQQIGAALGMTPAHLRGVIAGVLQGA